MRRQASRPQGFTLIEAAVAVGVIAILASAAAPLVMKALNQQRERTTRDGLKIAFEAMFGSRERRVANMRADYGFTPNPGITDLRQMMTKPGAVPNWFSDGTAGGMSWGWNGPYWTGALRTAGATRIPVDGWGRPIVITYVAATTTCQFRSIGSDGVLNTPDDIFYPPAPVNVGPSTLAISIINETRKSVPLTGTYQVRFRNGTGRLANPNPTNIGSSIASGGSLPLNFQSAPGPVWIDVNITSTPPVRYTAVVDLLSGETKSLPLLF